MRARPVANNLTASLAGRYRIEGELGAGGMATVYLAHDLKHERDVAIKILHADHLEVRGTVVPVLDDVAGAPSDVSAWYRIATNGTLVYLRASESKPEVHVVWLDRAGRESPAGAPTTICEMASSYFSCMRSAIARF